MTFTPPFPTPLIIALGMIALGVVIWRETFPGRLALHPTWFHRACLILKIASITILTVLLLNPGHRIAMEKKESRSVILIDSSTSMTLDADGGQNRWLAARKFAEETSREVCKAELPEPVIATFSSDLDLIGTTTIPTGNATNLAAALEHLLDRENKASLYHIIVVSDGRIHDREYLSRPLDLAKELGISISTHTVGVDSHIRNAALVAVKSPRMVRPRSSVSVDINVATTGFAPNEKLTLQLTNSDGVEVAHTHCYPGERPVHHRITFASGLRTDRYELNLITTGEPELDLNDNHFAFTLEIATKKLRILYAEGTHEKSPVGNDGFWWNNIEHITRAWDATGDIEHLCLTPIDNRSQAPNLVGVTFENGEMRLDPSRNFPTTREELHQYDVMFICGIRKGNFSAEQLQWVLDWVLKRGGGFLMGGGTNSFDAGQYDQTLWEKIIPVDIMAHGAGVTKGHFEVNIPEAVRNHPLWAISPNEDENQSILETFPSFMGMNRVRRAKPGALILATRQDSGEPIMATQHYGRGRAAAILVDPNGGWSRDFLKWGPPGSPEVGPTTVFPQGKDFVFDEVAAQSPPGIPPSNPCLWYGKFWTNLAQWLGQNSINWQRDKLSGSVITSHARKGQDLQVSAEVLAALDLEKILALNVGARLDLPGARRTRLQYDRDKREFTGSLPIPKKIETESEIGVLFDLNLDGKSISQEVKIGINSGNPEFEETSPDPEFLDDLARTTKGSVLTTHHEAVRAIREAMADRELQSRVQARSESLWVKWWIWGILGLLLCLEWTLRRRGEKASQNLVPAPI